MNLDLSQAAPSSGLPFSAHASQVLPRAGSVLPDSDPRRRETLWIELGLDDRQVLETGAPAGMRVAGFGGREDGLAQLAAWAALEEDGGNLHLVCHGAPGELRLGSRTLNLEGLGDPQVQAMLASLGLALRPGAGILLYACEVAQGARGAAFVAALARALGVPVAAARGKLGAAALGGDWNLDHGVGDTGAALAWPHYGHVLTIANYTTTFDSADLAGGTNVYYAGPVTGYSTPYILSVTDVAGSGWDITAQSSNNSTSFSIRGIGAPGFSYGDHGEGDNSSLRVQASDVDYVIFKANANGYCFDLNEFYLRNGAAPVITVQALDINGNPIGSAVAFSGLTANAYNKIDLAANADFQGIFGFKISFGPEADAPYFDTIRISNIFTPTNTQVTGATLSADTGTSATDFITNTAAQTISGTLSAALTSIEKVEVSFDNGATWSDATSYASGSSTWSTTTTLAGANTFQARVNSVFGGTTAFRKAYNLDTTAAAPSTPDMNPASDSGSSNTDNITSVPTPSFTGAAESGSTVTLYDSDGSTVLGSTTATSGSWAITSSTLGAGVHNLTAKITDVAGNVSASSGVLVVTIDTAAPTGLALSATSAASASAGSGATLATIGATDASAISYSLATGNGTNDANNGSFAIVGNSLKVAGTALGVGTYKIYLAATDAAGNVSHLAETFSINAAPSVSSIVRAAAAAGVPASATSAAYTVTFSESVTGVDVSDFSLTATGTAGGNIASVTGSGTTYTVTVDSLSGDGTLRLDLKASGTGIQSGASVGIQGGYTAGASYTLDHTAPAAPSAPDLAAASDSGSSNTDNITGVTTPTLTGTAESGSTVTLYDSDGSTVLGSAVATGGNWAITASALASGVHNLSAKATDAAGNVSSASGALAVTIDSAAPTGLALSATSAASASAGSGATLATIGATDASAISYSLATGNGTNDANNGSFAIVGNSLKVAGTALGVGTYKIYLAATDAAGNVSHLAETFSINAAPSVSSIVRAAAAAGVPASATSAAYTVTFSESVTGVDVSDFSLTATGTAGGNIASVTGSGTTYTVTVDSLSGDGTLRLDLNASGTGIQSGASVGVQGGYTAGASYTLDHTAPAAPSAPDLAAASDSGSSNTDNITGVTTPTLTGTAESGSTVTLYDSDGSTVLGSAVATGGNWAITASALASGVHNLSAKATDAAGNVSNASAALAVTIDSAAPTGLALSATSAATASAGGGATLATLSATDSTALSYALAVGNGSNDANNGSFTIVGNSLKVAGTALGVGTYKIYLAATDAAGNVSYLAQTFTVNTVPSVASIVRAGGAGAGVPGAASSAAYTVTFSESVTGVDVSDFSLTATGTAGGNIASVTGSGTTYTVTVDSLSGDGTLRLDLNASGTGIQSGASVGIQGGYTAGASYTLDHTAPAAPSAPDLAAASDSGSSNTDNITSVPTPSFTGTAESGSTVTLYDSDGSTVLGSAVATGGNWAITASALASGVHNLSAKATDAAGNVSNASAALAVTIDTVAAAPAAPVLESASDSGVAGDGLTRVSTPALAGIAEANASVTLYDSDGSTVLGSASADASGAWRIVASHLSDGMHALTVKQTDLAGNVSTASSALSLTIDTQAPATPATPSLAPDSDSGTLGDGRTTVTAPTIRGTAEPNARVTLYDSDGTTILGTAAADGNGNWSVTSSPLGLGSHSLTVKQADAAGNISSTSAPLGLVVEALPPPANLIDGVQVDIQPVLLPGGGVGTLTSIPVVTPNRVESSGSAGVADIPLASTGGKTLLLAQLPTGIGMNAVGGGTQPASTAGLIDAIAAATANHAIDDRDHLTGSGTTFLHRVGGDTPLLVYTVNPSMDNSQQPNALTLSGTSDSTVHTALVVDMRQAGGAKLALNAVDFAAIVGAADVTASTTAQVIAGDAAAQRFSVASSSGGAVFAGGGTDTLVFSSRGGATASANGGQHAQATGITTMLHGGQDSDTVQFEGVRADYAIEYHQGYLVVTPVAQPSQHALLINVESLRFADTSVAVENDAALTAIAGLYREVLGRQADYTGIDFWGSCAKAGASLGLIALEMIRSPEAQALHASVFNGNAAHDVELLYQNIYGRHSDAAGLGYWTDAMAHGASLEQVANAFLAAPEMEQHRIASLHWDFLV